MTRPALIAHPAVWTASDLADLDALAIDLDPAHIAALDDAVAAVRRRNLGMLDIGAADFPLGPLGPRVTAMRDTLLHGRGVTLIRGFPVGARDEATIALMYWGLGAHLGRAVSQSLMGDRLGHVIDASRGLLNARGYRSAMELHPHTDCDDIVGLLCLASAKSGGETMLASSLAIWNTLARERPSTIPSLMRGFPYHWNDEEPEGEPPITPYRVPVFSEVRGVWSCVYLRRFIDRAAEELGGMRHGDRAALDAVDACARRDDLQTRLRLSPGEALFFNNYTTLHARSAFVDHPEPARRRHLLRLWLRATPDRPVHPAIRRYYGVDGIRQQRRGSSVYQGDTMASIVARRRPSR